jgi:hypothetical protein
MTPVPRIRAGLGVWVLAIVSLSFAIGAWVSASAALAERAPLVLGAPFGEHDGLQLVDDTAGATALAWRTTSGEGQSIGFAEIPPGGEEASPVETVASVSRRSMSVPVLAIAPAGRVAVAWFEQRETAQEWSEDVLAVEVRERAPDGTWEATRTLWHAPAKPVYGSGSLVVALDDSGDAAVLWTIERELAANPQPSQLLVATRAAGGTYGEPVTLDRKAAEALPALTVTPSGEVTALWARPWRTSEASLNAVSWRAGSSPGNGRISLDQIGSSESNGSDEPFGSLSLQTSESGRQLAVWLKGPHEASRPEPVALRAAWREPGAAFSQTQTVTSPGVEAREPRVAFSPGQSALVVWRELTATGAGPDLNYATALPGAPFAAGTPVSVPLGEQPELQAAWLADGNALLLWRNGAGLLADRWTPESPMQPPIRVGRLDEESGRLSADEVQLVAGGVSAPVLAWIGRSPADSVAEAVRYLIAGELGGFPQPDPVPVVALTGSKKLTRQRGVTVRVRCAEACALTATAQLFALKSENAEEAEGDAYRPIGALHPLRRALPAQTTEVLELHSTRGMLQAFCRSVRRDDLDAVEVRVSVRLASGVERHFVLGETPSGGSCPR